MSYILDALRKSEQERQRGKVPDIHSAVSETADSAKKPNIWPIVTVAVVVLNVGILLFFGLKLADDSNETPPRITTPAQQSTSSAIEVQPQPQPESKPQPQQQLPAVEPKAKPAPIHKEESPVIIKPTSATDYPADPPMPSVGYLPQLEELPAYERDGIPDMTFSSHMFSSIPKYRSIIINGKRLKEGQFLNDELQVREITESGVVMSRGNTLFEVDVLGRWAQ